MLYSILFQIYFFRTGFQYDSIFFCDCRELLCYFFHLFGFQRQQTQWFCIITCISVKIQETYDTLFRISLQSSCYILKSFLMTFHRIFLRKKNGIVSPDYSFRSEHLWKLLKGWNYYLFLAWKILFYIIPISRDRKLKVISIFLQLIQSVQHRKRIFCPENNPIHYSRS